MWHPVHDQRDAVSPKQFEELKTEQKQKQDDFIAKAIKRANGCLLEIAGGETPTPYYGKHKGSGGDYVKLYQEYCAWLETEYAQETFDLIPNLLHLELCHFDAIDPQSVYDELRQRFVDAGWGDATRVHKRSGPENMVWVSLEPIEEAEEKESDEKIPMISSKQVATMEDHRVHYWLKQYGVNTPLPLRNYSNKQRRDFLMAYVLEVEKQAKIEDEDVKNGEDHSVPTSTEVRDMDRDQLLHWFKVFEIHSSIHPDRCSDARLCRLLISYLESLEESDAEEEEEE